LKKKGTFLAEAQVNKKTSDRRTPPPEMQTKSRDKRASSKNRESPNRRRGWPRKPKTESKNWVGPQTPAGLARLFTKQKEEKSKKANSSKPDDAKKRKLKGKKEKPFAERDWPRGGRGPKNTILENKTGENPRQK